MQFEQKKAAQLYYSKKPLFMEEKDFGPKNQSEMMMFQTTSNQTTIIRIEIFDCLFAYLDFSLFFDYTNPIFSIKKIENNWLQSTITNKPNKPNQNV